MVRTLKTARTYIASVIFGGLLALSGVAFHSAPVSATTDYTIAVPIETVIYGDEGTTHEITTRAIDSYYIGMECTVSATAKNQHSVHPNNNLTVASGDTYVVLNDVERSGHVITQAKGTITLDDYLTVSVVLGSDGSFSGGMEVSVACADTSVDVCRDGVVKTIKPNDRLDTDTNAPCPEPTVDVCRNDAVITINESDRYATDTDAPCPVYVSVCRANQVLRIDQNDRLETDTDTPCVIATEQVCRDGKIIVIEEGTRRDSDKDAPCEVLAAVVEVEEESGKETAAVLPNTGPAEMLAAVTSAGLIGGTAFAQYRIRRN